KLDISAQNGPQNALYVALQTGVADCAMYQLGYSPTISLQEVVDYSSKLSVVTCTPVGLLTNKEAYESLPCDLKATLEQKGRELFEYTASIGNTIESDREGFQKLIDAGEITLLDPFPEEDQAAFNQAVREVWRSERERVGPEAVETYQKVLDAFGN